MAATVIQSSGDLEIILLHEAHDTLASIIGPHLYTVLGDAPRQEIMRCPQLRYHFLC